MHTQKHAESTHARTQPSVPQPFTHYVQVKAARLQDIFPESACSFSIQKLSYKFHRCFQDMTKNSVKFNDMQCMVDWLVKEVTM